MVSVPLYNINNIMVCISFDMEKFKIIQTLYGRSNTVRKQKCKRNFGIAHRLSHRFIASMMILNVYYDVK